MSSRRGGVTLSSCPPPAALSTGGWGCYPHDARCSLGPIRTAVDVVEDVFRAGLAGLAVRGLVRDALPDLPLPTLLSTVTPRRRPPRFDHVPLPTRLMVRAVDVVAARALGPGTCLFRSLARYAALRQARVDARFVVGVAPAASASSSSPPASGDLPFVAHAWIEVAGHPVFEAAPPRYAETFCWPAREAPAP